MPPASNVTASILWPPPSWTKPAAKGSPWPMPRPSANKPAPGCAAPWPAAKYGSPTARNWPPSIPEAAGQFPPSAGGLECCVAVDGRYAATYAFRDEARPEGSRFVGHLPSRHGVRRVLLVSGDRESEVRYLAEQVGIDEVFAGQSPEDKLALVRRETAAGSTLFLGDGINDAPALTAATVGIAFGQHSDITAEAAGAVIMDTSLARVDEFLHIGGRMRTIALESALGGMALSLGGMGLAAFGYLPPVAGAIAQEVIDLLAVVNALRVAIPPRNLSDFQQFVRRKPAPAEAATPAREKI